MTRIAHIDRPVGARATLYPTISNLKPSLCFETSDQLLVAWGDCVMAMSIKETIVRQQPPAVAVPDAPSTSQMIPSGSSHGGDVPNSNSGSTIVKRRHVECVMAWELDCVACGIAPLDRDHLFVLGLIPNDDREREARDGPNDVEVQVISRLEGSVIYADVLPIIRFPSQFTTSHGGAIHESATVYNLVSSFSIPRMEDTSEAEEEGNPLDTGFDFNIFSTNASKATFVDPHLRWSMNSTNFDETFDDDAKSSSDLKSDDDSDDYGFILRPSSHSSTVAAMIAGSVAPVMVVSAPADLVLIRTRDVDDAISHALSLRKVGLALHRALRFKRMVRKHDLEFLVDSFLRKLLCITEENTSFPQQNLSIRRLELAAKSSPILLGGNSQRWEEWVNEFASIPGALFLLCDHIPVRGS